MEGRSLGELRRESCYFSDTVGQRLARKAAEAVHAEPDVEPVRADVDPLDQQRHDAMDATDRKAMSCSTVAIQGLRLKPDQPLPAPLPSLTFV